MKRFLIALAWLAFVVTSGAAESLVLSGRAMGTAWTLKLILKAEHGDVVGLRRQVEAKLERLEQTFSTYRPSSELSRFNATRHLEWIAVSPELALVAAESRRLSELTDGAFDVTVEPLVRLWGFGRERRTGAIPSAAEIAAARENVGWRWLEVRANPPALRKVRAQITADFSSMAKGFAADAVSALLKAAGLPNHLVQIGGDVRTGGTLAERSGWPIAIERPLDDAPGVEGVVVLTGQAVSTSGDFRNFFRVGDQRYNHIIDPRTGRPATGNLASVSVVHESCASSSALATALFALGVEEGFRLATQEHVACLFLVRDGVGFVRHATPEFEQLLR
ncbi:MAG: FAD:protein FMN transferase [Opitutaceae bacterium]